MRAAGPVTLSFESRSPCRQIWFFDLNNESDCFCADSPPPDWCRYEDLNNPPQLWWWRAADEAAFYENQAVLMDTSQARVDHFSSQSNPHITR